MILEKIGENATLIKSSEATLSDRFTNLETKYDKALLEQEERHKQELEELREDFESKNSNLSSEIDSIRQLIEGRSENVKLSNSAVQSAIKEVASVEYQKLQKQVSLASEKANSNKQYTRNWCLRLYGVVIPEDNVANYFFTTL